MRSAVLPIIPFILHPSAFILLYYPVASFFRHSARLCTVVVISNLL